MNKYVRALIKITKEYTYAEDFISGKLYMNNLQYFIKCEEDEIGDSIEAAAGVLQAKNPYSGGKTSIFIKSQNDLYTPAFCMFALIGDKHSYCKKVRLTNEKLKGFGKYAVVVNDVNSFLTRIDEKLPNHEYSLIRYIDYYNLEGADMNAIFNPVTKKHFWFKHQSEFRIYSNSIRMTSEKDLSELYEDNYINRDANYFQIDDISHITSKILTIDELFNGVKEIEIATSNSNTELSRLDMTTKETYELNKK